MNQLGFPILSTITFLPTLGALVLLFIPRSREALIKGWALAVSVVVFLLSLPLYFQFSDTYRGMQFVEKTPWVTSWQIYYSVGVDGLNLFLVLLTTLLSMVAILASWQAISERVKEYMMFMLLMETGMLGVFISLDLFLFYAFWEVSLIPMTFLIGRWGSQRRIYAAVKFFLFTFVGSALMLVAMITLYISRGTSDLEVLYKVSIPPGAQFWLFAAFALAFAVKVPLFPLHTWLPDAHVEAPTAGSVLLAGVLLKMGAYGYLRFCLPLFPAATRHFTPLLSILALIGIIYGALVALAQKDFKSLVAYSSVAHMGFVVLGIFTLTWQGIGGAVLQMVNHGLSTGALFLLVGVLYERRHTRLIGEFGGLWKQMPRFGSFLIVVAFSSAGLPGLNGFVGEFTILVGTFRVNQFYAATATFGIVLAAWYLLDPVRRMLYGELDNPANRTLPDMTLREMVVLLPLVILIFAIGLFPNLFFAKMGFSIETLMTHLAGIPIATL
jgi:NADH-quinone oxidoreductase subunit M